MSVPPPVSSPKGGWSPFSFFGTKKGSSSSRVPHVGTSFKTWEDGIGMRALKPASEPDVWLNLPFHGVWFIPAPPDPTTGVPTPQTTQLPGEFELRVPQGGRRIKGARLIRRTFTCLNMGKGREQEFDIIHESIDNVAGELILREGIHRLEFTHTLPGQLVPGVAGSGSPATDAMFASDQWPSIGTYLFVQIIGEEPEDAVRHPLFDLSSIPWVENEPPKEDDVPWLEKTMSTWRMLLLKHDPSPNGERPTLDDRFSAFVPELGLVEGRCFADNFTTGGPMVARLRVPSPSPQAIVVAARLLLAQTETLKSPRDGLVRKNKAFTTFLTIGVLPPKSAKHPDINAPLLWKGKGAGGRDAEGWEATKHGRFPPSWVSRWSTIPGLISPVTLEHELFYEIYFTVWGEDQDGKKLYPAGPGEVRIVRRSLKLVMPSCSLLPGFLELPRYDDIDGILPTPVEGSGKSSSAYVPCEVCGIAPINKLCQNCEDSIMPHVIHHYRDPQFCATCSGRTLIPNDPPTGNVWRCACADRDTWVAAGEPDEGLRIPDDTGPTGAEINGVVPDWRGRDEMLAIKLTQEQGAKR